MIGLYILGLVVAVLIGTKIGMTDTAPTVTLDNMRDNKESGLPFPMPEYVFRKGAHIRRFLKTFGNDEGIEIYKGFENNLLELIAEAGELIAAGDQTIDPVLLREFKEAIMKLQKENEMENKMKQWEDAEQEFLNAVSVKDFVASFNGGV